MQIKWRVWYFIRARLPGNSIKEAKSYRKPGTALKLGPSIPSRPSWFGGGRFEFLHREKIFAAGINWEEPSYGKLWTYNLNYFEFLNQTEIGREQGLALMLDFMAKLDSKSTGLEPFPTALRIVNWIKFLAKNGIEDEVIDRSLWQQLTILESKLEFHLLGNHLLENAFALLFGAYYFQDKPLLEKAEHLLSDELEEQVLADGAHFERSPMYHQLMLFRLLDAVDLVTRNKFASDNFELFLIDKAKLMISWLREMTFSKGDLPMVNDSAFGIAPSAKSLLDFAEQISSIPNQAEERIALSDSGYRMIRKPRYEVLVDVGKIGPDYIPGHAHSDTLSYILYADGKPFIVDTGTSTYEKNSRRQLERSTSAHNTVQVENWEQSEVWGGFRVARRAYPVIMEDTENAIKGSHTGYDRYGCRHIRSFQMEEDKIEIADLVTDASREAKSFIHFHPTVDVELTGNVATTALGQIEIIGASAIEKEPYLYCAGFNKTVVATKLTVVFQSEIITKIALNEDH